MQLLINDHFLLDADSDIDEPPTFMIIKDILRFAEKGEHSEHMGGQRML